MKVLVVIQARMSSTRLPGKTLMPLAGRPLLERLIERVLAARTPSDIVVATTEDSVDDEVVRVAAAAAVPFFRGHATDLLDRHYAAATARGADAVVKIPSDCPLIDPAVIDRVIGHYLERAGSVDFVSNLHPATYPDGNDVEVMPIEVLERAWRRASAPHEREHTTPFIWERPEEFRIANVTWETGLDYSRSHRWTIDYPEDYAFLSAVYDRLYNEERHFTLMDVLELLETRPDIAAINAMHAGKGWYREHLEGRVGQVGPVGREPKEDTEVRA